MSDKPSGGDVKSSVSFGFKKKIESKVDETKVIKEKEDDVQKEFLDQVNDKILNDVPKKKELIIPLIKKNKWNLSNVKFNDEATKDNAELDLQERAAKEIMKESAEFLEKTVNTDPDKEFENLSVPLLLKNKVPDGFETDDKLDVTIRPDEATVDDYESIPIEAFGMAMLRGMGWDPKVGIGKTFKQNVKMLETNVRPKGLGLGAIAPKVNSNKKLHQQSKNEDLLEVKVGAYIQVLSGSHNKKYGTVVGIDADNALCVVKFALGGKTASVGELNLKAVTKDDFVKYGKDLSRLTKAHEESEKRKQINGNPDKSQAARRDREERKRKVSPEDTYDRLHASDSNESRKRHKERKSKRESSYEDEKKKKKRKKEKKHHQRYSDEETQYKDFKKTESKRKTWLLPHLRVRMVDETYKKGKYYKEKLIVVDVYDTKGRCSCKTNGGMLLDNLHEDMLETVVPRSSSDAYVIITSGGQSKHDGKLAKILEKDKENCEAYLQLIEDRDVALRLNFDDICEYAGDIEAFDQF